MSAPNIQPAPATRGQLFVIAAPSGAGKTSLVKALVARRPELHVSISYTTRARRATEEAGKDYCFVSLEEFRELIAQDALLEHARVFDNYYGTARAPVEKQLARGQHVILEIDWQGAQQVRRSLPGCCSIFILPPSKAALERRLRRRATDTEEVIARRLMDAVGDMSHAHEFDYVLVNDTFDHAVDDLVRIIDGKGADLGANRPALQFLLAELTSHV
jgi:guanylate kinase